MANGAFEENIGETTIKTTCNDGNGFALYAIGYTGDTLGNNYLRDNAVFTQHGNKKLNLSVCNNITVEYNIPVTIICTKLDKVPIG